MSNPILDRLFNLHNSRLNQMLLNESFSTQTGEVNFISGDTTYYSTGVAVLRLHDLHLRAVGKAPVIELDETFSPVRAQSLFRVAAAGFITEIAVNQSSATEIGEAVVGIAEEVNSMEGMEGVFLSAFLAIDNEPLSNELLARIEKIGWPNSIGGGHSYSIVLDSRDCSLRTFSLEDIKDFSQLRSPLTLKDKVRAKAGQLSSEKCTTMYKVAGSTIGGRIGTVVGGAIGARGGLGGAVGGAVVGGVVGRVAGMGAGAVVGGIACKDEPGAAKGSDADKPPRADDGKKGDDGKKDDDPPKEVEKNEEEGCMPRDWDLRYKDPYRSIAVRQVLVTIPTGKGLNAFIVNNAQGLTYLSSMPRMVEGKSGQNFSDKGFLNAANIFAREFERLQALNMERGLSTEAGEFGGWTSTKSSGRERRFNLLPERDGTTDPPPMVVRPIRKLPPITKLPSDDILNGQGYRVEVVRGVTTVTDEDGKERQVPTTETTVYFDPSSTMYLLFGESLTGARAEHFVENEAQYEWLAKQIPQVFTPGRGEFRRGNVAQ